MKKTFTTYEKLCKLPLGWSLWGLLFFLIFATACTNDVAEVNTSQQQEQYVTVRMNVPGMQTSISRAAEDNITSITALSYDSNNKLTKIVSATNLNTENQTFGITVPNGTKNIHFLANNKVSLPEVGTDVSALTSLTTDDYNNLCYWGMATTSDGNTNPLSVTLYRNLAKISIKPSEAADAFNDFTQEQLIIHGLMNANRNGKLIPFNGESFYSNQNGTAPDYLTLPDNRNPLDKTPEGNNGAGYGYSLYVLEHDNPKDWDKGLYVICKIGGAYYKVALVGEDGEPYDIIRNHEYIIYVSDVDDYAYDSDYRAEIYSEAFNKKPINLDVQQEVIETVKLGISAATQTLNYNTTSIEQVTVTVTVPAGVQQLTLTAPGFTIASGDAKMTKENDSVYTLNKTIEDQFVRFTLTLNNDADATSAISVSGKGESITVTGAETNITISEGTTTENQTIWWQGAMLLDANDDATKLSIPYSYFFDGSDNRLIPIESEIYIDYETLNDGWIVAQTPNNGSNWQDLDGSTDNNNRITVKVTENVYTQINNHHNTVFDGIDAAFIVQGVGRVLKKITLKRAEPTIQTVTFSPTNDQTIYLGGDPLTVTMTVPDGGTLNTLNTATGFTINNTYTDSYTDETIRNGNTTVQYTFTPAGTEAADRQITFTGSGTNILEVNTAINVAVAKPTITATADKNTLYYDTDNQTTTITVNIPKGVSTLSITATDFTVTQYNNSVGNYDNGTYTLNNTYSEQTVQFVFTMNNVSSASGKTSTTIEFSDNSGVATSPNPITIALTEKPEAGEEFVFPLKNLPVEIGENGNHEDFDLLNYNSKLGCLEEYKDTYFVTDATLKVKFARINENGFLYLKTGWSNDFEESYSEIDEYSYMSYVFSSSDIDKILREGLKLYGCYVTVHQVSIILPSSTNND